jgi:hypothetical protein
MRFLGQHIAFEADAQEGGSGDTGLAEVVILHRQRLRVRAAVVMVVMVLLRAFLAVVLMLVAVRIMGMIAADFLDV